MAKKQAKFNLKTVTPAAMRTLKQHDLLDNDRKVVAGKLLDISMNEDQLKEVCEAIFEGDFSDTDFSEFDLSEFTRGFNSFLLKFWGSTNE
jgi:hypothetical protein